MLPSFKLLYNLQYLKQFGNGRKTDTRIFGTDQKPRDKLVYIWSIFISAFNSPTSVTTPVRDFFFFLSFLTVPWDMQYLSSPTKNQTHAPAVEVQSLNYWTTKEGPYGQIIITKEPRIYHGKRTVSLRNGFGKTGQPHAKE